PGCVLLGAVAGRCAVLPRESPKSRRFAVNQGWRFFCLGITAPLGGTPQSLRLETVFSCELLASLRAFTE
ncbi:hypothetical protein, partial [Brevibacillus centrosporus]|uniref:hypothetical protein n=1 Tax=Brevibacillus centrosporus TaxID=54910 RepID=UPI002E1E05CC|nr:hypothetical protein [Brevibacillus centrosporus]